MVELVNVTFAYPTANGAGSTPVLDGISIRCSPSTLTVIVGPSGCGKSTLLSVVAGLLRPIRGRVLVENGAGVGCVFQKPTLLPWRSVWANILFGAELRRGGTEHLHPRAHELINTLGLEGFEAAYPSTLSEGMQQRVALVRAILAEARVLLLDEPFGSSDVLMRRALQEDLSRAVDQEKLTAVLVTHDLEEAVRIADKIVVLSARPAHVVSEIAVPVPRDARFKHPWMLAPELLPYLQQVWRALEQRPAPENIEGRRDS